MSDVRNDKSSLGNRSKDGIFKSQHPLFHTLKGDRDNFFLRVTKRIRFNIFVDKIIPYIRGAPPIYCFVKGLKYKIDGPNKPSTLVRILTFTA